MLPPNQEILFTRQIHEAKKAGKHYDIRFVVGDKAYSFATKKDIPEVGTSILLYEQPVHDAAYALSERVEIPDGQYGAGVTTLDFVRKAKVGEHSTAEQMTIHSKGERFLLKKLNEHYGNKAWLFKNLGVEGTNTGKTMNKYLEKIAENKHRSGFFEPGIESAAAGLVGATVAGQVATPIAQIPITKILKAKPKVDERTFERVKHDVLNRTGATMNAEAAFKDPEKVKGILNPLGPSFMPKDNHKDKLRAAFGLGSHRDYIHQPKGVNTDVMLHEFGHAEDFNKGFVKLKNAISRPGKMMFMGGGNLAGAAMLTNDKTSGYAWTAPLIGAAPVMREEMAANHNALKLIKKHGGSPGKFRGTALANLLGYAAFPAAGSAILAGIHHFQKKNKE